MTSQGEIEVIAQEREKSKGQGQKEPRRTLGERKKSLECWVREGGSGARSGSAERPGEENRQCPVDLALGILFIIRD